MTPAPSNILLRLFLYPGDWICDLSGITGNSDHRQVLRSFINTIVWSAIASGIVLWAFLQRRKSPYDSY